ncbi:hypothetical protein [Methylomonas koyamae]|uniref:hypothetical protein n=1 Tax=Methylomonas koyamae TaxID=702114 RepID=UPI000A8EC41B|nr:hypothetical protein [Methylomonas koyamae]
MSSSKPTKFSEDELQALNPWTGLQDFKAPPHSEPVELEQATEVLTVEQIEEIQKQAYEEAFEQGRNKVLPRAGRKAWKPVASKVTRKACICCKPRPPNWPVCSTR